MEAEVSIPLARGVLLDGEPQREAVIRVLTGDDQARLTELAATLTPPALATALVACGVRRLGRIEPVTQEVARLLAAGDRERLLFAIYGSSVGPRIEAIGSCGGCGASLEVDLEVAELVGPRAGTDGDLRHTLPAGRRAPTSSRDASAVAPAGVVTAAVEEIEIEAGGRRWRVQLRVPNGGDLEHTAVARDDGQEPADALLARLVVDVATGDGGAADRAAWWPLLRGPLDEALARLDPQAQATVALACPDCGAVTDAVLDASTFVVPALVHAPGLTDEVHRLARAYHWSEAEILALPVARRRRYLELVAADGAPA